MSKSRITREHILGRAFELASEDGLESLTIGSLAKASEMSKSGVFAHFNSRENLQIAVIEYASDRFVERIIQPVRLECYESYELKLRKLAENWLNWNSNFQGSCLFLDAWRSTAGGETDEVQLTLQKVTVRWLDYLNRQFVAGCESGEFQQGLDTWQAVYQLYGVYLSSHLFRSMGKESVDAEMFWKGVDILMSQCRRV